MNIEAIVSVLAYVSIFFVIVYLRKKGKHLEIHNTDFIVALFPIVIYLLVSGKIESIAVGDISVKTAFQDASQKDVSNLITALPYEKIPLGLKGDEEEIKKLKQDQISGLKLSNGHQNYSDQILKKYMDSLSESSSFRYLVVVDENNKFLASASVSDFYHQANGLKHGNIRQLVSVLKSNGAFERSAVPGFYTHYATEKMTKEDALKLMQKYNLDYLPLLNETDEMSGVIHKEDLAASLILEIAASLN